MPPAAAARMLVESGGWRPELDSTGVVLLMPGLARWRCCPGTPPLPSIKDRQVVSIAGGNGR